MIKPAKLEFLYSEMETIGADVKGIRLMLPKGEFKFIKVQQLPLRAVHILKQEMLAKGAEAVVHKDVSTLKKETSDVLLMGTKKQYWDVLKKLKLQPFGLKELGKEIEKVLKSEEKVYKEKILYANGKQIKIGNKTLIIGILNVTPDSFSDGGKFNDLEQAVIHAKEMVENGADIIDVGGESTRPGHQEVSLEEELSRVIPIIQRLVKEIDVPISVDTYKAEVAKQAIEAGAHIINDVWGFKKDPNMAQVAAKLNVPVILMHNRFDLNYQSLMDDIIRDLYQSIDLALEAGVNEENIILDPGIGFAKTYEQNLIVMNRLEEIVSLGYPVLLGTSRKSIVGNTLNLPVDDRVEGTAATIALGIAKGCQIVRVHDVKEMSRVAKMMDAMVYLHSVGIDRVKE